MTNKKLFWIFLLLGILAAFLYGGMIWSIMKDKESLKQTRDNLLSEQRLNFTCSNKRDSLYKEVKRLSIYESLTKAMVLRDEATRLLKYKVGDIVYLKNDSSRVIISDIIIGGSKYEYYIKYKILYKDKKTEEVIPELIY